MPRTAWSDDPERQYKRKAATYRSRGVVPVGALERAPRTVIRERREAGETASSGHQSSAAGRSRHQSS